MSSVGIRMGGRDRDPTREQGMQPIAPYPSLAGRDTVGRASRGRFRSRGFATNSSRAWCASPKAAVATRSIHME